MGRPDCDALIGRCDGCRTLAAKLWKVKGRFVCAWCSPELDEPDIDHKERARQYENVLRRLVSVMKHAPDHVRTAANIIEEEGVSADGEDIATERAYADEMEKALLGAEAFILADVKAVFDAQCKLHAEQGR